MSATSAARSERKAAHREPQPVIARRSTGRRWAACVVALLAAGNWAGPITAQSPTPTPLPLPPATPASRETAEAPQLRAQVLGPVPDCTVVSELRPTDPIAIVGAPVTVTLRTAITCPNALDGRSVVLVVGGLPSLAGLPDARAGLQRIVDVFAAGADNRLAIVDVAQPHARAPWAATPDAFAAARAQLGSVQTRPAVTSGAWNGALDVAAERLAEVDLRARPFLIVVDGTGAQTDQAALTARIGTLGMRARDAAGDVILADLTSNARLFFSLTDGQRNDAPFVTMFPGLGMFTIFEEFITIVLRAYKAPLASVQASIFLGRFVADATCLPMDAFPPAQSMSRGFAGWNQPFGGHAMQATYRVVLTLQRPLATQPIFGVVQFERASAGQSSTFVTTSAVCAAGGPPAARTCPPEQPPGATPEPPLACPRLNALWLPFAEQDLR